MQLVEVKDAAAFEINLRLLKMETFSDPQVLRAVCDEKREDYVTTKHDKSEGEGPGQERRNVFCRDGLLPNDDGHGGVICKRKEGKLRGWWMLRGNVGRADKDDRGEVL